MTLVASCPVGPEPLEADGSCLVHGPVPALWRSSTPAYDDFADVLTRSGEVPVLLPWPLSPGWSVADFAVVCEAEAGSGLATVTTIVGTSAMDGEVELTLVVEEPSVGLGGRCSGTGLVEPTETISGGAPSVRVRVDQRSVALWPVPSGDDDDLFARSVFVGESSGRWLWLVIRPASAALLLRDDWLLQDASGFGPEMLDLPFGGAPPAW